MCTIIIPKDTLNKTKNVVIFKYLNKMFYFKMVLKINEAILKFIIIFILVIIVIKSLRKINKQWQ